jgi:hypothetical protein
MCLLIELFHRHCLESLFVAGVFARRRWFMKTSSCLLVVSVLIDVAISGDRNVNKKGLDDVNYLQ